MATKPDPADAPTGASGDPIDLLVPPPWPRRRRITLAAIATVVAVGTLTAVAAGVVGPRLSHGPGWGSDAEALADGGFRLTRMTPLHNDGWLPATIERMVLPPLDDVRWVDVRGLPVTLERGEVVEVSIVFEVAGCDLDAEGFDAFPVVARSGIAPERTVAVPPPVGASEPTGRTVVLTGDGPETTRPPWPEQLPSWVLIALEPVCSEDPVVEERDGLRR